MNAQALRFLESKTVRAVVGRSRERSNDGSRMRFVVVGITCRSLASGGFNVVIMLYVVYGYSRSDGIATRP